MSHVSVAYFPQCHMSNLRNDHVTLSILGVKGHFSGVCPWVVLVYHLTAATGQQKALVWISQDVVCVTYPQQPALTQRSTVRRVDPMHRYQNTTPEKDVPLDVFICHTPRGIVMVLDS